MKINRNKKIGQATVEYIILAIFILGGLLVIQKYLSQAIAGRWKSVGDSFANGRVFDPDQTLQCAFDPVYINGWYNVSCYNEQNCGDACLSIAVLGNPDDCQNCIDQCQSTFCDK